MASSVAGDLVGRVLSGRYRLLALIGMGASARVYLADDVKLRRRVAVKVLHASLADDEAFLRRFQREAESLAPLTHKNIVIIHDVNDGENALGEPPYLVTEYLAGGSLRNLLDLGYRLSPSQAARVGLDAAEGLQFAHARGIVHRDIKPANLLFGDDQRTRVADFGLAQALADFGRTEPQGSPMGTARYLSPEQARGRMLDGRSDVYSLALVLIEAMTGTLPFLADTWQGTAMARLDGSLRVPESVGALRPALEAAGTLDAADRVDASELLVLLQAAAKQLPRADRLPVDGSMVLERAAQLPDRDPTQHMTRMPATPVAESRLDGGGVVATSAPVSSAVSSAVPSAMPSASPKLFDLAIDDPPRTGATDAVLASPSGAGTESVDVDANRAVEPVVAPPLVDDGTGPAPTSSRRGRRVVMALFGIVALIAAGFGVFVARRPPLRTVPAIEGRSLAAARAALDGVGLKIREGVSTFDAKIASGSVVRQDPTAGSRLRRGREVVVALSKGEKPVRVPSLTGLSFDRAESLLRNANLRTISPPRSADSETVPVGTVLDWSPKGDVAPRSVVNVIVSSGPPVVAVPKVSGIGPEKAIELLTAAGLVGVQQKVFSDQTPRGLVAYTTPKSGTDARKGSTVTLFVSRGPDLVVVPNVINLSPADATAALRDAGLKVASTEGPADLPVLYTRPRRTTKVKRGTPVILYTTDQVPDLVAASTTLVPVSAGATLSSVASPTTRPATTRAATTLKPLG